MGELRNAYRILFGKTKRKISRGRHGRRLNFDIKIDLKDTKEGCELDSSGSGYQQVLGSYFLFILGLFEEEYNC
jgi:hypothetical protein